MDRGERDRRDWAFALCAWVVGFSTCWILTGPRLLAVINWDNGSYLSDIGSHARTWSTFVPWNAHFAIHNIYFIGIWLVRPFGGSIIDGFRLATSIFFGAAAAVVTDGARRLAGGRLLGGLCALAWMTSWVNLFLVLSLEDNLLFLAPAAGVIWLCALRSDAWRLRDSVLAGALAAAAALMSWQALLYLGPAFYVACVAGPRRSARERARHAAALFGAFGASLLLWILLIAITAKALSLGELFRTMFGRPSGRFALRSPTDLGGNLRALGAAAAYLALHTAYTLPTLPIPLEGIGLLLLAAEIALFVWASVRSFQRQKWALHVLAASALLFTVVTPLYDDVQYRYLVRFDFLPLLLVFLLALRLGELGQSRWRRGSLAALALLVLAQSALALKWDRARRASYPTLASWLGPHPAPAWYGRDGMPWYAYFRSLREAHPGACRYLFAVDELADGKWNLDLMGSLWSELPNHLALGPPAAVASWRFPPNAMAVDAARAGHFVDCAYVSPDARKLLDAR